MPSLGAIAMRNAPSAHHGAAAGLFFAWFDAGVRLGGPLAGLAVTLTDAPGSLVLAGVLVALAPLLAGSIELPRRLPAAARS